MERKLRRVLEFGARYGMSPDRLTAFLNTTEKQIAEAEKVVATTKLSRLDRRNGQSEAKWARDRQIKKRRF